MKTLIILDKVYRPLLATQISFDVGPDNEVLQELRVELRARGWMMMILPNVLLTTLDTMLEDAENSNV